ncbi:MAG: glycosyltransferase family 4 protein [Spirochaetaceae bacterium]|nr:glycosyltransferase family 4 protein [Spirochaetaceae bacterium]
MSKVLLLLGDLYFIKGRTGVGVYEGNVIWQLKCDYDIVVPEEYVASLPHNANPIHISKFKKKLIKLFRFFLPIDYFFKNYDYVLTGSCCFRKSKMTKQICIVHDLMSLTEPRHYSLKQKIFSRIKFGTLKYADKIIAVSNSTKQSIHDVLNIEYNKIFVVPNVNNFFIKVKQKKDFIFIGDMRKNKNLEFLIMGFDRYLKQYDKNEILYIIGNKKFEYEKLITLVEKVNLIDNIKFPGYINETEKVEYFSNAKAFIFLSDNEGFGIPLLEAASNKIPVLCSDIPVFHEVLDDNYAIFVNNKNLNSIADGFMQIEQKKISDEDADKLNEKYSISVFSELINKIIGED